MPQPDTTEPSTSQVTLAQCDGCLDDDLPPSRIFPLACSHSLCQTCLVRFFKSHTTLRADFPPKCCGREVYAHDYRQLLPNKVVKEYVRMAGLLKNTKRTLCATPTCGSLPIERYLYHNEWALCQFCVQLTCVRCGNLQAAHIQDKDADASIRTGIAAGTVTATATDTDADTDPPVIAYSTSDTDGSTLPANANLIGSLNILESSNSVSDIDTDSTLDSNLPLTLYSAPSTLRHSFIGPTHNTLSQTTRICPRPILDPLTEHLAADFGWKRCPSCHILVERQDGCSEMTCICGRRFCYECGGTLEGEDLPGACDCEWGGEDGPGPEIEYDEEEMNRRARLILDISDERRDETMRRLGIHR